MSLNTLKQHEISSECWPDQTSDILQHNVPNALSFEVSFQCNFKRLKCLVEKSN